MIYIKILYLTSRRAVCASCVGDNIDVYRSLFPESAAVGDTYKIGLNAVGDGLDVVPVGEKEYRGYRQRLNKLREERKKDEKRHAVCRNH